MPVTEKYDGWEELEMTIDSGATETVIGPRILLKVPITQTAQSIRGVRYEVANGVHITNGGEQRV